MIVLAATACTTTPPPEPPKTVFVTSASYQGAALGGLAGADAKCAAHAAAAGLAGTYVAWLSDATTQAESRITHSTGPYERVDGLAVALDWNDLIAHPSNPIDLDEHGQLDTRAQAVCGVAGVWTGAPTWWGADPRDVGDASCNAWTDTSAQGFVGDVHGNNSWSWQSWCAASCVYAAPLYCFEQ